MKKNRILSILSIILVYTSCQFNQNVHTDLITGAYSRGDGIGSDNVTININGKVEKRNEFIFGEKINFIFNNIIGLTNIENKTYPGLSMHIVKNEKDTVLSYSNLLKNLDDGTNLSPLQLQAKLDATLPYKNNEKYKVYITIWDKKGDGKFMYDLPFTIKENDLFTIKNNGIKYSNIYLWNETLKQAVFDRNVSSEHTFIVILDNIEGLELYNKKVFPIFSIDLVDSNENKIISIPNLLHDFETEGINPLDLKSQLVAKITLPKSEVQNPCKLIVNLKDKLSSKGINISTDLILH